MDYIPKTVVPTMRADKPGWLERHKRMVATLAKDKPDFVIMGDSITKAWEMEGKAAWAKYIAPLKAAPFGIAGDGVEHLLWRVENSGIGKDFQPKLVAILIGVNNLFNADAPEIAAGTKLLIAEIQQRSPSTKILLLGIFPVGEKPDDARRPMIKDVNALYGKLADQRRIFYMDIGDSFLDPNGSISKNTLFDFVHCTPKAYDIYAGKLSSKAKELMGN
ncbi:MAG: GDSL-type esterase/lipase family protein [Kiritimatiellaeota bacterium]|nr:GDSL-type esterase/lipase family protein [Kiritimatiellota bacterium]